jgi:2-polyprenyl-3-methyl-5-hydroxy-6-metoxy-1,4-benzoquinol methylase
MSANAIINHYRKHAAAWADARGDHLGERAWLDRFCALLRPQATVLDIGCGSGLPIARYLTTQGCAVTGVDSSPELIALFAQNLPNADAHVADMRKLDLGRRFDGVIAWDSFFHLAPDDQRRMFAIFAEHVAPNGALMFTSGPEAGEAIGEFGGDPLYHASLAPEEYRTLLSDNGFAVVAHIANDADCGGHTVWLAQRT